MLTKEQKNWNSYTLLVSMENGRATLKNRPFFIYKAKHTYHMIQQSPFPRKNEVMFTQKTAYECL